MRFFHATLTLAVISLLSACSSSSTEMAGGGDSGAPDSRATECGEAAPSCFTVKGGVCSDVDGPAAVCSGGAWSCPAGSVRREQCPCGVPPTGACLQDAGPDARACADAATILCFTLTGGVCNDEGAGPDPICGSNGTWSCPSGSVPLNECPCGVPPSGSCLFDAGRDASDAARD